MTGKAAHYWNLLRTKYYKYVVLFLLAFVPFCYSIFYVLSYWNPYDYLDKIPMALVNEDVQGGMGDLLVQTLLANGTVKFDLVSLEEAKDGIKNKDYYAYFHIPSNFTACVSSATTTSKNPGVIIYVPNHKANYLASQVINRIADIIENSVRATVAQTVTSQISSKIQELVSGTPNQLETMLGATSQLAEGSSNLTKGLTELSEKLEALNTSSKTFTDGLSKYVESVNTISDSFTAFYEQVKQLAADNTYSAYRDTLTEYLNNFTTLYAQLSPKTETVPKTIRSSGDELNATAKKLQTATSTMYSSSTSATSTSQTITGTLTLMKSTLTSATEDVPKLVNYVLPGAGTYAYAPVVISEEPEGEIKEYGKGFAPMFLSLAFWVIALLSYIFIYFDEDHAFGPLDQDRQGLKQNGYYAVIAAADSLLTGILFHLCAWIHVTNVPLYYFACLLTGLTAMAVIQMYMRIFGDVGKFFSVVTIILQLCACGGTFPFETMHAFFRWMHHVLPMTYSIQIFRECFVKIEGKLLGPPIGYLFVFLVVNFTITICYDIFISWKHRKDEERNIDTKVHFPESSL